MLLLICVFTFISVFMVSFLVLNAYMPLGGSITMRLKALEGITKQRTDIELELAKPFRQRVLSPLISELAAKLTRFTPASMRRLAEDRLNQAAGFGNLGPNEFLLLCGVLACVFPIMIITILKIAGVPGQKAMGLGIGGFSLGFYLPFLLINRKIRARKTSMQKALPDVLDLLTVSVEAGLGFDGALAKLSEKMKGALVDEFGKVLHEIRMGMPRRDALHAMGDRCGVTDLSMFTSSLVQADQLGVSIGNVLRVQSAAMRDKRKQRAEEKAQKAPVKMLFPLVLFIFPTIFIVLLGPALIQIMNVLTHK